MADLTEGDKVWVKHSNCGYQGPAVLMGKLHGSSWLVKASKGDEKIFLARAEFLSPFTDGQTTPDDLSKEEKKEIKNKYKMEKKNHRPSGDGRSRR